MMLNYGLEYLFLSITLVLLIGGNDGCLINRWHGCKHPIVPKQHPIVPKQKEKDQRQTQGDMKMKKRKLTQHFLKILTRKLKNEKIIKGAGNDKKAKPTSAKRIKRWNFEVNGKYKDSIFLQELKLPKREPHQNLVVTDIWKTTVPSFPTKTFHLSSHKKSIWKSRFTQVTDLLVTTMKPMKWATVNIERDRLKQGRHYARYHFTRTRVIKASIVPKRSVKKHRNTR